MPPCAIPSAWPAEPPPTWSWSTLAIGALVGTVAAMLAGWLSMRGHLHATVRETLGAAG